MSDLFLRANHPAILKPWSEDEAVKLFAAILVARHVSPQEVHIPGKKAFGFRCESKLFVSSVEGGSSAADWLQTGDEIIQVSKFFLHVC